MVENGYLIQERSPHDRRSFHVRAAEKGVEVYRNLSALFDQHSLQLNDIQLSAEGLDAANHALRRVQQFWSTPASMARNLSPAAA
jgi:DNA-binding MarR family transcriptional regulator